MAGPEIRIEANEVRSIPLAAQHLYLVYREASGPEWVIRGGPETLLDIFGGDFAFEINVDFDISVDARGDDSLEDRFSTVLDTGRLDADEAWGLMVAYTRLLDELGFPRFVAGGTNSNAFVGALLEGIGLVPEDNLPNGVTLDMVPGFSFYSHITGGVAPPVSGAVLGSQGDDTLTGIQISEAFFGLGGADLVQAGAGNDTVTGQAGPDTLRGENGDDFLYGDMLPPAFVGDAAEQVFRLYATALGRVPDTAGYLSWVTSLVEGKATLQQVANGFLASAEYTATDEPDQSDSEFVAALYTDVLGRDPDSAGQLHWLSRLATEYSRAEVVLGFSESPELQIATREDATAYSVARTPQVLTDEIFALYRVLLDRVPDTSGFLNWMAQIETGAGLALVAEGLLGSPEFRQRHETVLDDKAFTELLYANGLNRPADAGGQDIWLSQLESGVPRWEIAAQFVQSAEVKSALAASLNIWMRANMRDDVLEPGNGNNTMAGGFGADTFVFSPENAGENRILDLEPWDTVDLTAFEYMSMDAFNGTLNRQDDDIVFTNESVIIMFPDTAGAFLDDVILIA